MPMEVGSLFGRIASTFDKHYSNNKVTELPAKDFHNYIQLLKNC